MENIFEIRVMFWADFTPSKQRFNFKQAWRVDNTESEEERTNMMPPSVPAYSTPPSASRETTVLFRSMERLDEVQRINCMSEVWNRQHT